MKQKLLYLFTRTPLHVGAGASVGAIDQPIIRERHTGFPIIPASSLKGSFADQWPTDLRKNGKPVRLTTKKEGEKTVMDEARDVAWLFGSDDANVSFAGALQFGEARLLAFPIRSAKGSFAWIISPLILRRALRDGVIMSDLLKDLKEPADEKAIFDAGQGSKLALGTKVVLEEYTFEAFGWLGLDKLGEHLAGLMRGDAVWSEIASRLVVLSDGMMSFFAQNSCEVAQHVRISDETGTAEDGALFNQENVPSETLFYSVVHFFPGRGERLKTPDQALRAFQGQDDQGEDQPEKPGVRNGSVFQFGGDASTGLGYCTVRLADPCNPDQSRQT